jgi:iron(III) transport system substrate-binding protein
MEISRRSLLTKGAAGLGVLALSACGGPSGSSGSGSSGSGASTGPTPSAALNLDDSTPYMKDLIKAAQAEYNEHGPMNYYTSVAPNVASRLTGGFTGRYGVLVNVSRLTTALNSTRITAEAESGKVVGDVGMLSDLNFLATGQSKGWFIDPATAGLQLPAVTSFPSQYMIGNTAYTQEIATYSIAYNTNLITGDNIPKSWKAMLDPQYKGAVMIPDPRGNDSTLSFFYFMSQTYGMSFLTQLAAQKPKVVLSSVDGLNSLAAGDVKALFPNNHFVGAPLIAAGAPFTDSYVQPTTSNEEYMFVLRNSPHPKSAELFLNYALSPAGQYAQCSDLCSSVLNTPGLIPSPNYKPLKPLILEAIQHQSQVLSAMGLA